MQYAQLNEAGTECVQVSNGNIQWDANNFCSAEALIKDGKGEQFRVVSLTIIDQPAFDPKTDKCFRDGNEFVGGKWCYKWTIVALTEEEIIANLHSLKVLSLAKINNDDNKIYADVVGNKTTEYLDAAAEAKAFKDAGYPTGVDNDYGLVKSWADAKQWTMQQAADDILAQEAAWKGAAKLIRDYRLKAKESVKRATTIEEIETVMATWNGFVTMIRTQLGVH